MGQILGLGITHYPGLSIQGNLSRRIKYAWPTRPCRSVCVRWKIGRSLCAGSGEPTRARAIPTRIATT